MAYNPSVARFKADLAGRTAVAKYNMHQLLVAQANEMAQDIAAAAPEAAAGETDAAHVGALKRSVRVIDVSRQGPLAAEYSVVVRAGGRLTTRRTSTGHVHEYALDTEFGNSKEAPEPFFFSTARRYLGIQNFSGHRAEELKQSIAENRKIQEVRAYNQDRAGSSGGPGGLVEQTASHHGASVGARPRRR